MNHLERRAQHVTRWRAWTSAGGMYRMAYDAWERYWEDPFRLKKDCDRPDGFVATLEYSFGITA